MTKGACAARLVATWFGCGLAPKAPGTVGAIGAIPLHFALRALSPLGHATLVVAVSALGVWCANEVARRESVEDPQFIVIDEVAGTLIAMGLVRDRSIGVQLAALILFRVLDITKPGAISNAEKARPPGLGIMLDDLLAGLLAGGLTRSVLRR